MTETQSIVELPSGEQDRRGRIAEALTAKAPTEQLLLEEREQKFVLDYIDRLFSAQRNDAKNTDIDPATDALGVKNRSHYKSLDINPADVKSALLANPEKMFRLYHLITDGYSMDIIKVDTDGSFVFVDCAPDTTGHDFVDLERAREIAQGYGAELPAFFDCTQMHRMGDFDTNGTSTITDFAGSNIQPAEGKMIVCSKVKGSTQFNQVDNKGMSGVGLRPKLIVPAPATK